MDSYAKYNNNQKNLNKINSIGTTPGSGVETGRFTLSNKNPMNNEKYSFLNEKENKLIKKEESDLLDYLGNKNQSITNKNDFSENGNVYEKIFHDLKKENSKNNSNNSQIIIENVKNNTNNTDKDLVNYAYGNKSLISEKENTLPTKNKIENNLSKNKEKNDENKKNNIPNQNLSKIPSSAINTKSKVLSGNKNQNRISTSTDNNINNLGQGESVIFLHNLEIEKEDFKKDLNNFFSPQSRINEEPQNPTNQSKLSSFNNHNNTSGNNNISQDGKNINSNKILTTSQNQKINSETLPHKEHDNQIRKNEDILTQQLTGDIIQISQSNLNKYFDLKNKSSENKKNLNPKSLSEKNLENEIESQKNKLINESNLLNSSNILNNKYKDQNFMNIDAILNQSSLSSCKLEENNKFINEIKNFPIKENLDNNPTVKEQSADRLKKIYSILEQEEDKTNQLNSNNFQGYQNHSNNLYEINYDAINQNLNYANINNTNTAEILNMALELKESKKTIISMKDIIDGIKKEIKIKEEAYKKQLEEKLSIQKFEYEKVLDRQKDLL